MYSVKNFVFPFLLFVCFFQLHAHAKPVRVVLKDGRILVGDIAELSRVDERAEDVGKTRVKLIVVLDDGLRYVYFPKYNIRRDQIPEASTETFEVFKTGLQYTREGQTPKILGEYDTRIRFDPFGRRLIPLNHYGGVELASQTITELTPKYVRVRGNHLNESPFVWDMRLATNSIPRDQLTPILMDRIDPKNYDDRIRLVRFYIQGALFDNALEELDGILKDWQDDPDIKQRLSSVYRNIRLQKFERYIKELELRWKAGQYQLVKRYLVELEKNDDLPEQLYMQVGRMLQRYDDFEKKRQDTISLLRSLYRGIPEDEKNDRIPPILDEIEKELSMNTMERLATFHLYSKDSNISDSEKLAIALTGWFAGSNTDNRRLSIAAGFPETRRLIFEYLQSGNETARQQDIINRLNALESFRPELIARILAYAKAPADPLQHGPKDTPERPGYYRFEVENPLVGTVENFDYVVQLPPEYDPNRRYPMIVTLNGLTSSPDTQLDWWAGSWRGTERYGQATRHGYIVVAPNWNPQKIMDYDFSALSHAAVLNSVRDAFRRFNVDTDRVFISGHGIGGTAAWDIALAHPDLWAGAIPFNAVASKFIVAYKDNPQHVPLYLVGGELEGHFNVSKFLLNAAVYNRYLDRQHDPYDVTVIRFIGRGMEGFSDEILNIFEWMRLRQRNFTPLGFTANSMRPWDHYFWWVELDNLNREASEFVRDPVFWPERGEIPSRMVNVSSKLLKAANGVQVTLPKQIKSIRIFLSPDMIDFNAKTSVRVNNINYHPSNGFVEPDIAVILGDAKTRGDRLHPFWAVLDNPRR